MCRPVSLFARTQFRKQHQTKWTYSKIRVRVQSSKKFLYGGFGNLQFLKFYIRKLC